MRIPCSLCRSPPPSDSSEEGLETDKIKRQCSVIFLVKNLLRIPHPQCEELLRVYGDPEEWITLCSPCTSLLNQALDINAQINQFKKKIDELGEQLALPLKIKPEDDDEEWESATPLAAKEIRRIVFNRGAPDLGIYHHSDIPVGDKEDEDIDQKCPTDILDFSLELFDEKPLINTRGEKPKAKRNIRPKKPKRLQKTPIKSKSKSTKSKKNEEDYNQYGPDDDDNDHDSSDSNSETSSSSYDYSADETDDEDWDEKLENLRSKSTNTNTNKRPSPQKPKPKPKKVKVKVEPTETQSSNDSADLVQKNEDADTSEDEDQDGDVTSDVLKCISIGSLIIAFRELRGPDVIACLQPGCGFKCIGEKKIWDHLNKDYHSTMIMKGWHTLFTENPMKISKKIYENHVTTTTTKEERESVDVPILQCTKCVKQFYFPSDMENHLKQMHRELHTSELGGDEFLKYVQSVVEMAKVVKIVSPPHGNNEMSSCPFCDVTTDTSLRLATHIRDTHHLHCHVFPREGADIHTLSEQNKDSVTKAGPTPSTKSFDDIESLLQSLTKFNCPEVGCDAKFRSHVELLDHKSKEHPGGYTCDHCSRALGTLTALENHIRVRHYDKRRITCPTCGWAHDHGHGDAFQFHLKKSPQCIEKTIPCPHCEWRLECKDTLDIHIKAKHSKEHQHAFHCPHCGKGFKYKCHLYKNHVLSHTEDITQICELCGHRSLNPAQHYSHVRMVHALSRDHKCSECSQSFKTRSHLKRHALLHNDVFAFCCDSCGKRFRRKDQLTSHLRSHDPNRGEQSSFSNPKPNVNPKTTRRPSQTTRFRGKPPPEDNVRKKVKPARYDEYY